MNTSGNCLDYDDNHLFLANVTWHSLRALHIVNKSHFAWTRVYHDVTFAPVHSHDVAVAVAAAAAPVVVDSYRRDKGRTDFDYKRAAVGAVVEVVAAEAAVVLH